MSKARIQERGIILFIVLATIFVVILLGNIVIGVISTQSRLTRHKVSRIQAYYAALAGVNYALEKLGRGNDATCWSNIGTYTRTLRRSGSVGCDINDFNLPTSIQQVEITVGTPGTGTGVNSTRPISAKATFTYTP